MEQLEYKTKDGEKRKAVDVVNLLGEMEEIERFNGTTEAKIHENWYELKRRIAALFVEGKKDANE